MTRQAKAGHRVPGHWDGARPEWRPGDESATPTNRAVGLLAHKAHTLSEGAGAAALAGLLHDDARPPRCAVVCTGGNASDDDLAALQPRPLPAD